MASHAQIPQQNDGHSSTRHGAKSSTRCITCSDKEHSWKECEGVCTFCRNMPSTHYYQRCPYAKSEYPLVVQEEAEGMRRFALSNVTDRTTEVEKEAEAAEGWLRTLRLAANPYRVGALQGAPLLPGAKPAKAAPKQDTTKIVPAPVVAKAKAKGTPPEDVPGAALVLCGVSSWDKILPKWAEMGKGSRENVKRRLNKEASGEIPVAPNGTLRDYLELQGKWPPANLTVASEGADSGSGDMELD